MRLSRVAHGRKRRWHQVRWRGSGGAAVAIKARSRPLPWTWPVGPTVSAGILPGRDRRRTTGPLRPERELHGLPCAPADPGSSAVESVACAACSLVPGEFRGRIPRSDPFPEAIRHVLGLDVAVGRIRVLARARRHRFAAGPRAGDPRFAGRGRDPQGSPGLYTGGDPYRIGIPVFIHGHPTAGTLADIGAHAS